MRILYSFNKTGYEANYWTREISGASDDRYEFIPFNHGVYLNPNLYLRAQLLDNLYSDRHPDLARLYADFESRMRDLCVDALIVDTCPPYHPDFLRQMSFYKVLRIADGPISAYDRDFAYLHAYDHILYHSPAYSRDLTMREKLRYCGARTCDLWPLGLFDAAHQVTKTESNILAQDRDIDVIFIGALHLGKMPLLAAVKKALGGQLRMHGLTSVKRNVYFNFKFGFPGWIRRIPYEAYVPLYQRSKIGINVHNRGEYTVGNYRLFELPGNGVMQISDGGKYLNEFFEVGTEVVEYGDLDDLIRKVRYYLEHDEKRREIAVNGYRRAMKEHRISYRMRQMGELIEAGMRRVGHSNRVTRS